MGQKVTYFHEELLHALRKGRTGKSCTKKEKYTAGLFFINYPESLVSVIGLCYS